MAPLVVGENFVLAASGGLVCNSTTRPEKSAPKFDVPASRWPAGSIEAGKQWLVAGHDGSLLWIEHGH